MHNLTKPGGYIIIKQAIWNGNGYFKFDESFFEGIAAANNYKIIFNSYVVNHLKKTKQGSNIEFHIPRNRELFNALNFEKIVDLDIYGVLQKTKDDEFKIPYQGNLMKEMYNVSAGFNRTYQKDPMSYSYLPSATLDVGGASFKLLIKALIIKIKRIIRLRILKKR